MTDAALANMHSVLEAQRAAFMAELPVGAAIRKDRLKRVIAMLVENAEDFCAAMSEDFGHRSREQSMMTDITASIRTLRHTLGCVERWMRPERRKLDFPLGLLGARAAVEYQPKGVVGIIVPWNFPVQLTIGPLAGVFAAGNRAMVKSSEYTPTVSALFERLALRYFDPAELACFSGGPEVGQAFAELPFDHMIFTGATSIGRHILHAAADNLTPVTLELGGKSPTIFGRSADLAQATERVAMGKMLNAGQICLAPDYLLVPEEKEGEVVEGLSRAASTLYPSIIDNPDYTAVVNDRHLARLNGYIEDARAQGADVMIVNPAGEDFSAYSGRKMPLHILRNVTDDMKVMQEEIFGPLLPVRSYAAIDDAIDYVNAHDHPLGLYYFGSETNEQRRVLDRTISGGVTLNDVVFHVSMEDLPFGGIGPSGMGSYHGLDGFRTFSHARAVYRQPRIDVAKLAGFKPPYGNVARKAIARDLRG